MFPDMTRHCNSIPSIINGYTCNPPNQTSFNSTVTGYCSGFMWGNTDESFTFYNQPVSTPHCIVTLSLCTVTLSHLYSDTAPPSGL